MGVVFNAPYGILKSMRQAAAFRAMLLLISTKNTRSQACEKGAYSRLCDNLLHLAVLDNTPEYFPVEPQIGLE